MQHLGAVPNITESYLLPLLEALITALPFTVEALHADNGSEYVNHRVVELLNKLRIGTFTKSRPRRTNDNALVESKPGASCASGSATSTSRGPSSPVSTPSCVTPSPPSSTSTGPACSPSTSQAPPDVSKSVIPKPRSPPPTTACAASPTPSDSSDRTSLRGPRPARPRNHGLRGSPGCPARPRRTHAYPRKPGPRLRRLTRDRSGPSQCPGSRHRPRSCASLSTRARRATRRNIAPDRRRSLPGPSRLPGTASSPRLASSRASALPRFAWAPFQRGTLARSPFPTRLSVSINHQPRTQEPPHNPSPPSASSPGWKRLKPDSGLKSAGPWSFSGFPRTLRLRSP